MTVELVSKLHQLRRNNRDWLLTLLTAVLTLMIFVFAPLQAAGIFLFQTFAIAGLLVIIAGALIVSGNPFAFVLMFYCQFCRLFLPAVLSVAIQPAPVGRRVVDHCGHSRNCGRSGSVRGRPHHLSPSSRSDPSVPVDCGDLRNAVRVCRPVDSRCIQGDRV